MVSVVYQFMRTHCVCITLHILHVEVFERRGEAGEEVGGGEHILSFCFKY